MNNMCPSLLTSCIQIKYMLRLLSLCTLVKILFFATDSWVFHPSWHMCIYKRMFESENKTLTKEGVIHFLDIWQTKHIPMSPGFSEVKFSSLSPPKISCIVPPEVCSFVCIILGGGGNVESWLLLKGT